MGQYQQWLHYREQEQQLHAQLEKLEAELAELQSRASPLPELDFYEQNPLLHLLVQAVHLPATSPSPAQADQSHADTGTPSSSSLSSTEMPTVEKHDTTGAEGAMPVLFPWNGSLDLQLPSRDTVVPSTPLSHPEIELLPTDMASFFDEHTRTSPQLQSPWWMRQRVPTSASDNTQASQRTIPSDQESMRNNREIERWLERWRREPASSEQEGNRQHE